MTDIAIFVPSMNGGGAERVMSTLANQFFARGFSVDLLLASVQGPFLADINPGVRVVDLQAGRVSRALFPLIGYLRRERPATMLAAMSHANVIAILARSLSRVRTRLVVSERNTPVVAPGIPIGFRARINGLLVPFAYRFADGVCTVSEGVSAALAQITGLPRSRVVTIYNPFDLEGIARRGSEPIDHYWFSNKESPVILGVGRLSAQKDFPTLIRAFSTLRQTHRARLLILGEGEDRATLKALIDSLGLTENDVQMPGFAKNPQRYMARCDLFVLSSLFEGLPGVLVEAMACGAPVVSTNCPSGPDEILEGGRWGRLVPVNDVQALAQAMAASLDTPRSGLPDVRRRAQDFAMDRSVDAYLKLLGASCQ